MRARVYRLVSLQFCFLTLLGGSGGIARAETIAVRCGQLIDGTGARPVADRIVLVEGKRISAIGSSELVSEGVELVDLGSYTCLPGLIDAHAHPLIATDDYQVDHLRRSSGYKALRGLKVLQEMLNAGWTTVRIPGDSDVYYATWMSEPL